MTRILTAAHLDALLSMALAVPAVEVAFRAHARGETQMPPKVYIDLPEHEGDFRAMPSAMGSVVGLKWVNSHAQNPARHGLPTVMGVYILSDPATALPRAILDATLLTAYRTSAAAAVASRALGPADPERLAFIGCGVQAHYFLAAHREVFGDGLELRMADTDAAAAETFAAEARAAGWNAEATSTEAACDADLICTATPSHRPVLSAQWLRPGAHINAMGADGHGKQELPTDLLKTARVVVDDRSQALGSGEINVPVSQGELTEADLHGTLGEVLEGLRPGREAGSEQITIFDSTGLALQDLALARAVLKRAEAQGAGLVLDLVGAGGGER